MHLTLLSTLTLLTTTTLATQTARPALKDSTILRSTVSCTDCPENNCYKCTYGHSETLRANTGGLAWVRSLVGFQLPVPADTVTECSVQFPAFVKLPQAAFNITVVPAISSDWDEETVNGENAPESSGDVVLFPVDALSNPPRLDVTGACRAADEEGRFSFYIGADFGSFEVWSKDSGNPAVLHVTYD